MRPWSAFVSFVYVCVCVLEQWSAVFPGYSQPMSTVEAVISGSDQPVHSGLECRTKKSRSCNIGRMQFPNAASLTDNCTSLIYQTWDAGRRILSTACIGVIRACLPVPFLRVFKVIWIEMSGTSPPLLICCVVELLTKYLQCEVTKT